MGNFLKANWIVMLGAAVIVLLIGDGHLWDSFVYLQKWDDAWAAEHPNVLGREIIVISIMFSLIFIGHTRNPHAYHGANYSVLAMIVLCGIIFILQVSSTPTVNALTLLGACYVVAIGTFVLLSELFL